MTTVYIAGPMSGYDDHNRRAFEQAAMVLRAADYDVVSPWELDGEMTDGELLTTPWEDFLARDLAQLLECDLVCALTGWQASRGASLEVHVARQLGKPVVELGAGGLRPVAEIKTILEEAQQLVKGNRGADYGHPINDFSRTGRMWGAILGLNRDVTAAEVAMCMVALKLSREVNRPKRDNRVDAAGYVLTLDMVRDKE